MAKALKVEVFKDDRLDSIEHINHDYKLIEHLVPYNNRNGAIKTFFVRNEQAEDSSIIGFDKDNKLVDGDFYVKTTPSDGDPIFGLMHSRHIGLIEDDLIEYNTNVGVENGEPVYVRYWRVYFNKMKKLVTTIVVTYQYKDRFTTIATVVTDGTDIAKHEDHVLCSSYVTFNWDDPKSSIMGYNGSVNYDDFSGDNFDEVEYDITHDENGYISKITIEDLCTSYYIPCPKEFIDITGHSWAYVASGVEYDPEHPVLEVSCEASGEDGVFSDGGTDENGDIIDIKKISYKYSIEDDFDFDKYQNVIDEYLKTIPVPVI